MLEIRGIVPPLVTPLDSDGEVDTRSLRTLTEFLLAGGVHGLFVLGSTGEGPSLDARQRDTVIRAVVETASGRVPVLAGVTDLSLRRVAASLDAARAAGADGAVVAPTYYYVANQMEIIRLFRGLARRHPFPLVAYNLPQFTKVALDRETVTTLAREGTVCAVKDSSPDLSATRELLLQTRDVPGFAVLTGLEFLVDAAVAMGMAGAVPGLANVAPRAYVRVYDDARAGRAEAARTVQDTLIHLFQITRQGATGQSHSDGALAGFKAALKLLGVIRTSRMCEPMVGLTAAEEERVGAILRELRLL